MKEINANELYAYLNDLFPPKLSAPWDKIGLQIPEVFNLPSQDKIRNVVTCLDVTRDVVEFAIEKNSNLIISRHPFIFNEFEDEFKNPAKKVTYDKLVAHEIQVYSIHTNYDASDHQSLPQLLLSELNIDKIKHLSETKETMLVDLLSEMTLADFNERIKFIFGISHSKISRNANFDQMFQRFYVCSGAGASFMRENQLQNTVFLTGEAKWNDYLYAYENNVTLICVGHYMENYFIDDLQTKILKTFGNELDCYTYDVKNMWILK